MMLSENRWKVILLVAACACAAEPSRALSLVYPRQYSNIMFIPKNFKRTRKQRVLFLDDDENHQSFNGPNPGEIDLTLDKSSSKIKFDDNQDYEFTSEEKTASGNERYYEPAPRFRPFQTHPAYYQGRYNRPYAPNYYDPYHGPIPFAPLVRNSFYSPNGWKARSPRVVFPYATDNSNSLVQTNGHTGPNGVDNVVFRDQNFGTNDIGTDEQSLQDIGTGSADAFAERDANDQHRARNRIGIKVKNKIKFLEKPMFVQTDGIRHLKRVEIIFPNATTTILPKFKPISDEQMHRVSQILRDISTTHSTNLNSFRKGRVLTAPDVPVTSKLEVLPQKEDRQDEKKCPQGGTCEYFFYCWMVGGLLEGSCGGLLRGCCHRVAKAGILGVQDSNSIEYSPNEGLSYGPVINDESKCGPIFVAAIVVAMLR